MHFQLRTRQLRVPHRWNPNRTLSPARRQWIRQTQLIYHCRPPLAFALAHKLRCFGFRRNQHDREPTAPVLASYDARARQHPLPSPTTSTPANARRRQKPAAPHSHASGRSGPSRPQRRKWVCPEGTSVRSLVEAKEREVGLRCDDLSCMCGPEDDAPTAPALPLASPSSTVERVYLHKARLAPEGRRMAEEADAVRVRESTCAHAFHAECLVVSARSYDSGLRAREDPWARSRAGGAAEVADGEVEIEIACPRCRARGLTSHLCPASEF